MLDKKVCTVEITVMKSSALFNYKRSRTNVV